MEFIIKSNPGDAQKFPNIGSPMLSKKKRKKKVERRERVSEFREDWSHGS